MKDMLDHKDGQSIDAAKLYYNSGFSQAEVARHLGVSRPTVSKLLSHASARGFVTISINDPRERTTYGLITWLKQHVETPVVAIGCDARHGSAQFQRDAAQVISAAGGKALVLPAQNPTPLTAMHGVGAALGKELLTRCGFRVSLVPEQAQPDPDFPTVSFPNPEEPGALDLGIRHAEEIGADILIAYDPDADRCAAAVPTASGSWRQLTGFKWIARTPDLAFGYEEAIGFCPDPTAVRDKDGIATSVVLASLAAECKAAGTTLLERLEGIYATVGALYTQPLTFRVDDLSIIAEGMDKVASTPPTELAGSPVAKVEKFAQGSKFFTDNDDRVIVRPSGTEPKLKCYLESPRCRPLRCHRGGSSRLLRNLRRSSPALSPWGV